MHPPGFDPRTVKPEASRYTKDALPAPKVRNSRSTLNEVNTFSFHSLVVSLIDTTFSELLTDVTKKSQKKGTPFGPTRLNCHQTAFNQFRAVFKFILAPAQKSALFMNNKN